MSVQTDDEHKDPGTLSLSCCPVTLRVVAHCPFGGGDPRACPQVPDRGNCERQRICPGCQLSQLGTPATLQTQSAVKKVQSGVASLHLSPVQLTPQQRSILLLSVGTNCGCDKILAAPPCCFHGSKCLGPPIPPPASSLPKP